MSARWTDDEPNWLMTLSDLTLLLLCFLALCYVGYDKQRGPTSANSATVVGSGDSVPTTPEQLFEAAPAHQELDTVNAEMEKLIADSDLGGGVRLELASRGFVISISDTVSFASGKATLRARTLPLLDKLVALISSYPDLLVEVSGHADSRRISNATFPSNWELSAARASRVARYFIAAGVDPSRIAVQGYGSQRPRTADADADNGGANRRVEIRLYRPGHTTATAER